MKKFVLFMFAILLAFNLQAQVSEVEFNDTWQTANKITLGQKVSAKLGYDSLAVRDEIDWYCFDIPSDGIITVTIDNFKQQEGGSIAAGALGFEVKNLKLLKDNDVIDYPNSGGYMRSQSSNTDSVYVAYYTRASKGTTYISIGRNYWTNYGHYDFKVEFTPTPILTDKENNDTWENAIKVNFNETYSGHLGYFHPDGTNDGKDWYYFDVPGDGTITVTVNNFKEQVVDGSAVANAALGFDLVDFKLLVDSVPILYPNSTGYMRSQSSNTDSTYVYTFNRASKGTTYFSLVPNHWTNFGYYQFKVEFAPTPIVTDKEDNDTWENAIKVDLNETVSGHLGYFHPDGTNDGKDWYYFDVPGDGTITVTVNNFKEQVVDGSAVANAALGFDLVDFKLLVDSVPILYPNSTGNMNSNSANTDSTYVYTFNRASKGTTYFSLIPNHWTNFGYYQFKIEFEPAPVANDKEDNDDEANAVEIALNEPVPGHLGYFKSDASIDEIDWYKVNIPGDGIVTVSIQTFKNQLTNDKVGFDVKNFKLLVDSTTVNYPGTGGYISKSTSNDSLAVFYHTRAKEGTAYISIVRDFWTKFGNYQFTVGFEPVEIPNDNEPNDDWTKAVNIPIGDTISGHIGYINTANQDDVNDWYKITLPNNGTIHMYINTYPKSNNMPATDEICRIYPDFYFNVDSEMTQKSNYYFTGDQIPETMNDDRFAHLSVKNLGASTYYININRKIGFGCYKFYCTTATAPVPDFNFIQQTQDNGDIKVCFFNKSSEDATEYEWNFADNSYNEKVANPTHIYRKPGVYPVSLIVKNEAGSDTITKDVEIYGLQRVERNYAGQGPVTVRFNAGGIKDNDKYILVQDSVEYEGIVLNRISLGITEVRFHMEQAQLGWYDAIIRHADGNEMSLPNAFRLDKKVEPEVYVDLIGRDMMLFGRWQTWSAIIGNKGNVDAYNQTLYIVCPNDENVSVKLSNVTFTHPEGDTLAWLDSIPPYLVYDSVENDARSIRVYPLMFSVIPANTEYTVYFKMRSMKDEQIGVFTTNPFFKDAAVKEYDSYEDCVAWSIAKFAADKAVGFLISEIPGAGCVKDVLKFGYQTVDGAVGNSLTVGSVAWSIATTAWSCAKEFCGPLKAYKMACDIADFVIDVADNYNADQECQKYKNKDKKKKKIRAVSSFDPNEMVGPLGIGDQNDTRLQDFTYQIYFENKATASAAAQEVVITDTLDKTKFDLSSIQFDAFGFSDSIYRIKQSGLSFVEELNWDSVIVRVSGTLDTLTGVASWQFITLDPKTMELTENPNAGFLPANVNPGEGEGFVSFTIALNKDVKDGDYVENEATIVFDVNEPIKTNLYSNRIDENKPTSTITRVEKAEGVNDNYTIYFEGSDKGSGINFYRLSALEKGTDSIIMANHITEDHYTMALNPEKEYWMFVQAVDNLYIEENEKDGPDYIFSETGIKDNDDEDMEHTLAMGIQPNPAQRSTTIAFRNSFNGKVNIEIFNMIGVKVYDENLGMVEHGIHYHQINVGNLPKGIYAVKLQCGNEITQQKLMIQ